MKEVQLWQYEGLGVDADTLEKVISHFKSEGVQGIESQQALNRYVKKMGDTSLRKMYEIDKEAAIQITIDCLGASEAFHKYARIAEDVNVHIEKLAADGWLSPEQHKEINREYEEHIEKLREEKDEALTELANETWKKEKLEEKIKRLEKALALHKGDLYDFYAKEGRVPNYEY